MKNNYLLIFFKGILMGICDLIPGISGGTIAFITGIYDRLISAVKSFSPKLVKDIITVNKVEIKKGVKSLDLSFLIILFLGIITAILIGSRVIEFLLYDYFSMTLAFFIGLIIASSKIIFDEIKDHSLKNISFGSIGLIIGIILSFAIPINITPTIIYVFFGGFIAISAMFLPGISGAFILLIMGLYEFMINSVNNITERLPYIVSFLIGAVFGALFISRVISYFFQKDRCKTLYVLLGLVIGALAIPIKRIYLEGGFAGTNFIFTIIFLILGLLIVMIAKRLQKRKQIIIGID